MKVAVIDYGLGNIQSVVNAIESLSADYYIAKQGSDLAQADKIVLPGVGAFDAGMQGLIERGYIEALRDAVLENATPFLGICLGFQFLFEKSEEGELPGLSWLEGEIVSLKNKQVKVPHIGWNELHLNKNKQSTIFADIFEMTDAYFVHSFCLPLVKETSQYDIAQCFYGDYFVAAVQKENIFGVQFHPEKSQLAGLKMIQNFLSYNKNEK